ncbi:hypothetical protein [Helicobacter hepaticus]|jgi:hypothetical protein|uniref:Uncharacterized protein n=1 Tax=Helicobacter hepaticus (strain ATCC 51449 / 3B1) TaxID=235279 RepID=Q7VJ73_HELHP|nr:hypothetical protein [Helicobacter hepaticus]AAP76967.1 hypothetical protein HH_0370 [Helicobacter hepaticus ATCC 51449]
MGIWAFLAYMMIFIFLSIVGIINIIAMCITFFYAHRIRKHINRYFFTFAYASLTGCMIGSVIGVGIVSGLEMIDVLMLRKGAMAILEDFRFSIPFISLVSIICAAPTFIVLSFIILRKNTHSAIMPSSKKQVFTFGFLSFSILSFLMWFASILTMDVIFQIH